MGSNLTFDTNSIGASHYLSASAPQLQYRDNTSLFNRIVVRITERTYMNGSGYHIYILSKLSSVKPWNKDQVMKKSGVMCKGYRSKRWIGKKDYGLWENLICSSFFWPQNKPGMMKNIGLPLHLRSQSHERGRVDLTHQALLGFTNQNQVPSHSQF